MGVPPVDVTVAVKTTVPDPDPNVDGVTFRDEVVELKPDCDQLASRFATLTDPHPVASS